MPLDDPVAAYLSSAPAPDPKALVDFYADKYGVDKGFAHRIANQESGYNQKAISPKGAIGVMQLTKDTAKTLGVDPHDINQNIEGGIRYLKQHLDEFGNDQRLAAAAYNAGPHRVREYGGVPPFAETQNYVNIVAQDPTTAYLQNPPGVGAGSPPPPTPPHEQTVNPTDEYLANSQLKTTSTAKPKTNIPSYQQITPEAAAKGIQRGVQDKGLRTEYENLALNADVQKAVQGHSVRLAELEAKQSTSQGSHAGIKFGDIPDQLTDIERRELTSLQQERTNAQEARQKALKGVRQDDLEDVMDSFNAPGARTPASLNALAAFIQKHGPLTDHEKERLHLPNSYLDSLPINAATGLYQTGRIPFGAVARATGSQFLQDKLHEGDVTSQFLHGALADQGIPGALVQSGAALAPHIVLSSIAPEAEIPYWFGAGALESYSTGGTPEEIIKHGLNNLLPIAGAKVIGRLAIGGPLSQLAQRTFGNAFLNTAIVGVQGGDKNAMATAGIMGLVMGIHGPAGEGDALSSDIAQKIVVDPDIQKGVAAIIAKPESFDNVFPTIEARLRENGLNDEQVGQFADNIQKASSESPTSNQIVGETTTTGEPSASATSTPTSPTEDYLNAQNLREDQTGISQQGSPLEEGQVNRGGNNEQSRVDEGQTTASTRGAVGETQREVVSKSPPENVPPINETNKGQTTNVDNGNLVGIKNEFLESQAESRQEPLPSTDPLKRDYETIVQQGKYNVDSGKVDPIKLAEEIANKPRSLTPEESTAMLYRHTQLLNEEDIHLKAVNGAKAANDPIAMANARTNLDQVQAEMNKVRGALKLSAHEKGLTLGIQRVMMNEDYSLARMEARAQAAKRGKPLTDAEKSELADVRTQMLKDQEAQETYDERKSKGEASKTVAQLRKETMADRKAGRTKKKSDLNAEFAQHKAELAALFSKDTTTGSKGLGGPEAGAIDPEMVRLPLNVAKILRAMAKNRIAAGVNSLDGVVDAVHSVASEFGDFTKRQIRDAISGYNRTSTPLTKDVIDSQLDEVNKLARRVSKLEDIENDKLPEQRTGTPLSPEVKALDKQIRQALKEKGVSTSRPIDNETALANYKERLAARKAELDNMIATEKFYTNDKGGLSTSKPKNKITLDPEAEQLKANTARSKAKAEAIIRRIDEENRTPLEKSIAILPKFFEGVKLSSSLVLGKLTGFGAARVMLLDPMEGLIGSTDRINPLTKNIRESTYGKGGRGQSTAGDYVMAIGDLWKNYANVFKHWDIIRGRHTDLDLKYGKPNELPIEMLGVFRRVHKMLKNPVVEAEFNRYNKGYLRQAQSQGLDITDPRVILESGMKAYAEAYRDILLGKNRASDTFSQKVGELGRGSITDQAIAAGFRSALPIVKVPINYALEESSYGLGAGKGMALLMNKGYSEGKINGKPVTSAAKAIFGQGLKTLTPEEGQQVLRAYHKQGVGLALMALGYFGYKSIGGYYVSAQDEESRRAGKKPMAGQTQMFGVTIPSPLVHNPAFEVMQGMATFHHALDYYHGKKGADSLLDPALTTIRGSLEHIPFYEEPARAFRGLESGQKATDFIGNELRGAIIPPDVQRLARIQDQREPQNAEGVPQTVSTGTKVKQMLGIGSPNTKKRKAKGSAIKRIGQQIELGLPKIPLIPLSRQSVPLKQ